MSTTDSPKTPWDFKNFRYFTYAGMLLPFASQLQSLLVGWQIYEIKHDPLYLGFIGLVEAVPALSLALIAGYIVDHSNPLKVYKRINRLQFLSALMLLGISLPGVPVTAEQKVSLIYLAAFIAGLCRGFRMPARTALVPQLVPRNVLHISAAWGASTFSIASALGPAIGGFLYAWGGPLGPYSLNVFMIVIALILNAFIKIDYQKRARSQTISTFQNLTAGINYVFGHQLLLSALALDMFAVLFGGVVALLPVFAAEILNVGPTGLGILRSASSVGALIGSVLMIRYPVTRKSGRVLLASVAIYGFCMIGFGLSKSFLLSLSLLAIGGAFDSVSMVIRGAIVQLSAPDEMRGRIGAVNSVFIGVSNQLGEFESGVAAKLLGTVPSVVAGGIVTVLVVIATAIKAPKLRRMEISKL